MILGDEEPFCKEKEATPSQRHALITLTRESYLRSEWGVREVLGPSPVHAVSLRVTSLDIME